MRLAWLALLAVVAAGCGAADDQGITVYAASSLTDAFGEAAIAFTDETRIEVSLSFGASSTLRAQIEQGAPADVFASADARTALALVDAGVTDDDAIPFATNALAIVVPADGSPIDGWTDLAQRGVRIVAAGEAVPITRYADQLVDRLAALPEAPAGFADAYRANVASREDNVRAALTKVALGVADAAIVYQTDAADEPKVRTVVIPPAANVAAEYDLVGVRQSTAADRFVEWLLGEEGRAILARHGFGPRA